MCTLTKSSKHTSTSIHSLRDYLVVGEKVNSRGIFSLFCASTNVEIGYDVRSHIEREMILEGNASGLFVINY